MKEMLKTYIIQNLITKEYWQGKAYSVSDACYAAGWQIGNCYIRYFIANEQPYSREKPERGGTKISKEKK